MGDGVVVVVVMTSKGDGVGVRQILFKERCATRRLTFSGKAASSLAAHRCGWRRRLGETFQNSSFACDSSGIAAPLANGDLQCLARTPTTLPGATVSSTRASIDDRTLLLVSLLYMLVLVVALTPTLCGGQSDSCMLHIYME